MPLLLNEQPVRPQKRPFQASGIVILTLVPGESTQPVVGKEPPAAATQTVSCISLTKVTVRCPGAGVGVLGGGAVGVINGWGLSVVGEVMAIPEVPATVDVWFPEGNQEGKTNR